MLRLVFLEKNELTLGVLIGLLLLITVLMLVRSVLADNSSDGDAGSAIDAKALNSAIEGALKKVMVDRPLGLTNAAAGATAEDGTAPKGELSQVLAEREAKIAALMSDIEALKAHAESGRAANAGGGSGKDSGALEAKVAELQAKLTEYEIIEDDIADLSLFKEENRKLKDELERLKSAVETAQSQVQSVQASVAQSAPVAAKTEAPAAAVPASELPKFEKKDGFELDPEDDVMKEFAKALGSGDDAPATGISPASMAPGAASATAEPSLVVSGSETVAIDPQAAIDALMAEAAAEVKAEATPESVAAEAAPEPTAEASAEPAEPDPFGDVDTDKMLAEVAELDQNTQAAESVLDEALDTEKLMAEMGLEEPAAVAAAPAAEPEKSPAPPPMAPVAAAAPTAAPSTPLTVVPEDDLLAEFKDTSFDANKGTKGS